MVNEIRLDCSLVCLTCYLPADLVWFKLKSMTKGKKHVSCININGYNRVINFSSVRGSFEVCYDTFMIYAICSFVVNNILAFFVSLCPLLTTESETVMLYDRLPQN